MQALPKIFDDSGVFMEPDAATLATLPPEATKRLDEIRAADGRTKAAEQQLDPAQAEITAALAQVAAAKEAVKPYGEYNFLRLWTQAVHGQ